MSSHSPVPAGPRRRTVLRLSTLVLFIAAFSGLACRDDSPTGPRARPDPSPEPFRPGSLHDSGFVFSNRAHAMRASRYRLLSDPAELDRGVLRYQVRDASQPRLGPDDFVVAELDGEQVVRRVLEARTEGETLLLETGPGSWSDIVRSGTHKVTMPLDGRSRGIVTDAGIMLDPVDHTLPGVPIPDVGITNKDIDLCAVMDQLAAQLGGVCGNPGSKSFAVGFDLELEGQLDSLLLMDVNLGVSGDMDVAMTVDGGGLVGGTPPTFFPCNQRAYLGCLTTPTGAAFITWLRQYAPNIPEASLPPVRVCVPGLPVRTRAGYWDRSTLIPRWVPPLFTTCRISSAGALPQVVLPSAGAADLTVRPRVTGGMTIRAKGNMKLTAKIPLGPLGVSAGKGGDRISAKGTLGLFILVSLELRNTVAEVRFDFDNLSTIIQQWDASGGWSGDFQSDETSVSGNLNELGPDSIVFRVGVLAEASGTLCAGLTGCDPNDGAPADSSSLIAIDHQANALIDLNVGANLKVGAISFIEAIRTQQPIGPPDSNFVMGKVALQRGKEIPVSAGITIPFENFLDPPVPLSWDSTFATVPLPIADSWETVGFNVRVATTGVNPDPDGYRVVVERTDTLPPLYADGTIRIGAARDHGRRLEWDIEPNGVVYQPAPQGNLTCSVAYTDIFKPYVAGFGKPLDGARLLGEALPVYFVAFPCWTLAAQYRFTLEDVADNCAVVGGNGQERWIPGVQPLYDRWGALDVALAVECSAATPTGSVQVTTSLSDSEYDPLPYALRINGNARGPIAGNATRTISGVGTGTAQVSIVGGSGQCTIPAVIEVNVVANATAVVAFDGPCFTPDLPPPPPGTVIVSPVITGTATDDNGFLAVLDGRTIQHVPADGSGSFSGVAGARPTVVALTDVDPSCRPITPLPMVFDLGTPTGVATLQPQLECTDAAIRTLLGTVERAPGGGSGIALRLASGAVRSLAGPLAAELAQLEGAAVDIWGTDAGIALTVHGYSLVSTLSEPRATGVLLQRDGAYWLLGRDAILLSDPPAALTALAGSYVWVGGAMPSDSTMRPSVFGLLRSVQ